MKYKLLVVDMDGTLLNSSGKVSETNKSALMELHSRGIHIAVATGRIYTTARVYAKYLGIITPIICCNGAIVKYLKNNEKIYGNPIPAEKCLKIIEILKSHDLYFHFYSEDTIYGEKLENKMLYFSEWAKTLKEEDRIKIEVVKDSTEIIDRGELIYKFGFSCEDHKILRNVSDIIRKEADAEVYKSLHNITDIMNRGVTKGKAVERLAKHLGVKREEVIAVGDNENDINMLQYAGLGVAMGNAEEKIKKYADCVTDTNDNDGVAKVIEKFIL